MICESCGGVTRVSRTQSIIANRGVLRYRICKVCDHRFTSYELSFHDMTGLMATYMHRMVSIETIEASAKDLLRKVRRVKANEQDTGSNKGQKPT